AGGLGQELQQALLQARQRGGPAALTVREALRAATIGGARCLGRTAEIGSLETGKLADIAVWRMDGMEHAGITDPVAALVLGSLPPLLRLFVGGETVVSDGRPVRVDPGQLATELRTASSKLVERRNATRIGCTRQQQAHNRHNQCTPKGKDVMSAPTHSPTTNVTGSDGLGGSPQRPDGTVKVSGEFAYSSDLWHEDMVWGATLRSPHPSARIRGIDITEAIRTAGVYTVLTHEDVPGENAYGLEHHDQPVLAGEWVRYQGEPVALVAADHPETARRAMEKISVDYEVLDPVTDAEHALSAESALVHEQGNIERYAPIRHG